MEKNQSINDSAIELTSEEKVAQQLAETDARLERARVVAIEAEAQIKRIIRERRIRKGLTYLLDRPEADTTATKP